MNHFEAFSNLGIPVTKDISAIRQAYRKELSRHHPEEDPQGFMWLNQSYKAALAYAQGNSSTRISPQTSWQPEKPNPSQDKAGYDSLFSGLEAEQRTVSSLPEKQFRLKLLWLKLHWLPVPLKCWQKFFGSQEYLLCRGDPKCLDHLFNLIKRKIHTHVVFRFLLNRLWELDGWLKSEGLDAAACKVRSCIEELNGQYSHYQQLDSASRFRQRILPVVWYYQALPFYFKLIATLFLFPVLTYRHYGRLLLLEICFYSLEYRIRKQKKARNLGIFYIPPRDKKGIFQVGSKGDGALLVVLTFYAIILHLALCYAISNP